MRMITEVAYAVEAIPVRMTSDAGEQTLKTKRWLGFVLFFSSRRRHTRFDCDWSSDVCSSDLDGSCVRDFVHVLDLADAHTRAIEHLLNNGTSQALNLGTGDGTTVKELLETVRDRKSVV